MVRGEGKTSNGRTTTRARSRPSPGRFLSAGMYGIHHRYFCSPEEEVRPALNPFVKIGIRLDQKSNPTWRWLAAIVCRPKEKKSRPRKLGIPDIERCIPDGFHRNSPKLEMDGRISDAKATIAIRFSPSRLMCCIQEGDHLHSWGSLGEYTLSKGVWPTSFTPTLSHHRTPRPIFWHVRLLLRNHRQTIG